MDAGPLLATPPVPQAAEPRRAEPSARDDDTGAFAERLDAELESRDRTRAANENESSRDTEPSAEDDEEKQKVTPAPYFALSVPLAPAVVRPDDAPPPQTLQLDALAAKLSGQRGDEQVAGSSNATLTGAANDPQLAAQAQARTDKSLPGDARKEARGGKLDQEVKGADSRMPQGAPQANNATAFVAPQAIAQAASNGAGNGAPASAEAKKDSLQPPPQVDSAMLETSPASQEARRYGEPSAPSVHRPPTIAATVAQNVIRRFNGDSTRIELRLDPAELGRVQVRLDVNPDSSVTAVVAADNPATLSDLMRSARELERALQSAGLELASGGLSFDLSQSGGETRERSAQDEPTMARGSNKDASAQDAAETTSTVRPFGLETWRGVRVDMTV